MKCLKVGVLRRINRCLSFVQLNKMILKIHHYILLNGFTYVKNLWLKSLSKYLPTNILEDDGNKNNNYIC